MPSKVKKYSKATVEVALEAVKSGEMSLCRASELFNIPKTTLIAKKNGTYQRKSAGNPTKLLGTEEDALQQWILKRAELGFPVNIDKLKQKAEHILRTRTGKQESFVGIQWSYNFLKRHPELSQRKPSKVSRASANVSENDLRGWHQKISEFLSENDLLYQMKHRPDTIINVDETGFQLVPANNTVLGRKGAKAIYEVANGQEKAFVTVMFAVTAAGKLLPPMMLFNSMSEAKRDSIMRSVPKNWGVAENPSGYMTGVAMKHYLEWLSEGPLKNIEGKKIIFLDNHGSHKTKEVRRFCRNNDIDLISLYPNSTRTIQPLDIKVFLPIKTLFRSKMQNWSIEHPGDTFDTSQLAPMIEEACKETVTEALIKASFKDSGIHPWNVENIDFSKCLGKNPEQSEIPAEVEVTTPSSSDQSLQQRLNFHLEQAKLIKQQIDGSALGESSTNDSSSPTSASEFTVLDSSEHSLQEILALPPKPKRMGKRSQIKMPFVITSDGYKAITDAKERETEEHQKQQQERRLKIAGNKAAMVEKKRLITERKIAKVQSQTNKENKKKKAPTSFNHGMFDSNASQIAFTQPLRDHNAAAVSLKFPKTYSNNFKFLFRRHRASKFSRPPTHCLIPSTLSSWKR